MPTNLAWDTMFLENGLGVVGVLTAVTIFVSLLTSLESVGGEKGRERRCCCCCCCFVPARFSCGVAAVVMASVEFLLAAVAMVFVFFSEGKSGALRFTGVESPGQWFTVEGWSCQVLGLRAEGEGRGEWLVESCRLAVSCSL